MTLGSAPEALVLGYLRNQRLVESPEDIESIQVDWETDSAAVKTRRSTVDIEAITSKRVVTTGCGQGTMFGGLMEDMAQIRLPEGPKLHQAAIVDLLEQIRAHETIYKKAGSVHACAVFERAGKKVQLLHLIEDDLRDGDQGGSDGYSLPTHPFWGHANGLRTGSQDPPDLTVPLFG
jgi:FdhD protein